MRVLSPAKAQKLHRFFILFSFIAIAAIIATHPPANVAVVESCCSSLPAAAPSLLIAVCWRELHGRRSFVGDPLLSQNRICPSRDV